MDISKHGLTTRAADFATWYQDVIEAADLAEHGDVKGTMVIKPYGYAIWERIQSILDKKIKETGHQNAYFPLFIPKSFFAKEAEHVEGFAKEMAVVTHHRLKQDAEKGLVVDPEARLTEEIIVRPTSETVIHTAFARWIKSWRDLPVLINQWANVVRMELRPRMFLRTTEFLWQEGHTAHATEIEAEEEAKKMLAVYKDLAQNFFAMAVIDGQKTESEKFPGALRSYTIEAMMQDGKALQTGTSHNLGQNFAKAFDVTFLDQKNEIQHTWMTSWGVSTRLIGGLIMSHSDDKGLVLPPNLAPTQVVIIPIWKTEDQEVLVKKAVDELQNKLEIKEIRVMADRRKHLTLGERMYEWEKKGIPVTIQVGPRDIEQQTMVAIRRDTGEKQIMSLDKDTEAIKELLSDIQVKLFEKSEKQLAHRTYKPDDYQNFQAVIDDGGFFDVSWCGDAVCETQIKEETKATIRCIPFNQPTVLSPCFKCGKEGIHQVILARAY